MSKKNCSNCQFSIQDFPDLFCLFRKLHTQDGLFENCHCFLPKSVFDRITASPEVLAENLVYRYDGNGTWRSFLLYGYEFLTKEEAYAATVAKLNEVCVEQNAVDDTQARLRKVDNRSGGAQ
jgi:hypothetical protein